MSDELDNGLAKALKASRMASPEWFVPKNLLQELQHRRDCLSVEAHHHENSAREKYEQIADIERAIAALQPASEIEQAIKRRTEGYNEIIAALTPAPEAEPGSDALAEFMKRPGAIEWTGTSHEGPIYDVRCDELVEVLLSDGAHLTGNRHQFNWSPAVTAKIIAYRIISEPAGEGESEQAKGHAIPYAVSCILKTTQQDAGLMFGAAFDGEPQVEEWEPSEQIWTPGGGSYTTERPPASAGYQHVVDAEPAPVLRADVPADATTFTAPSGELFATFNGQTHLVLNDPPAEQSEPYSAAHEAEEQPQDLPPLFPPEAPKAITPEDMEARGLVDSEASWWARKMAKELV